MRHHCPGISQREILRSVNCEDMIKHKTTLRMTYSAVVEFFSLHNNGAAFLPRNAPVGGKRNVSILSHGNTYRYTEFT